MAEQTSTAPEKSAGDVRKSHARSDAEESSSSKGSSSRTSSSSSGPGGHPTVSQTYGGSREGSNTDSLVGKSLEYNSGPGRDAYEPGLYQTDAVNDLPHLAVHMTPRDHF